MDLRVGYKQADVGLIPKEWGTEALGTLSSIERGKFSARPRNDPRFYGGEFPFLQTGDVTRSGGKISSFTQTLNASGVRVSRLFPRGTLFFTIAANIGDVGIADFEAACPDSLVAITPKPPTEKRWLLYELSSRKNDFEALASPGAQLNINLEKLRPYILPVPTPAEQRAIAAALSDVDALLTALDRLITKKRDLKQAAMQQLLTGQTRLPGFSGGWKISRLGDLGAWKGGMTPSMRNLDYWQGGSIPWISSGDVKSFRIQSTGTCITPLALSNGTTTLVPAGSIILVMRSGILRRYLPVAVSIVPMAINQDIKALLPSESFAAEFLLHTLVHNGDQILRRCMKTGTTVESIDFRWLKDFEISTPPLGEQKAIAAALSDMDAEIKSLEARRDKTRDLKQAMMQELLTGRTRLVPATEPA